MIYFRSKNYELTTRWSRVRPEILNITTVFGSFEIMIDDVIYREATAEFLKALTWEKLKNETVQS